MLKLLLAGDKSKAIKQLESVLENYEDAELFYAESGEKALGMIKREPDLVVTDENLPDMTGLEFAEKLIKLNPVINCAVVTSLSEEDFHEASEGLGLMAYLPPSPEKADVEKLIEKLRYIKSCLPG